MPEYYCGMVISGISFLVISIPGSVLHACIHESAGADEGASPANAGMRRSRSSRLPAAALPSRTAKAACGQHLQVAMPGSPLQCRQSRGQQTAPLAAKPLHGARGRRLLLPARHGEWPLLLMTATCTQAQIRGRHLRRRSSSSRSSRICGRPAAAATATAEARAGSLTATRPRRRLPPRRLMCGRPGTRSRGGSSAARHSSLQRTAAACQPVSQAAAPSKAACPRARRSRPPGSAAGLMQCRLHRPTGTRQTGTATAAGRRRGGCRTPQTAMSLRRHSRRLSRRSVGGCRRRGRGGRWQQPAACLPTAHGRAPPAR